VLRGLRGVWLERGIGLLEGLERFVGFGFGFFYWFYDTPATFNVICVLMSICIQIEYCLSHGSGFVCMYKLLMIEGEPNEKYN
jgi:hypothetical protein